MTIKPTLFLNILIKLLTLLCAVIPLAQPSQFIGPFENGPFICFLIFACVSLFAFALHLSTSQMLGISFTSVDILLAIFVLYLSLNYFLKCGEYGFSRNFCELILLIPIYCILRYIPQKGLYQIFAGLMLGSCLQVLLGLLQLYEIYPSNNLFFPVTGSFSNPGPYSGYLASLWPPFMCVLLYRNSFTIIGFGRKRSSQTVTLFQSS